MKFFFTLMLLFIFGSIYSQNKTPKPKCTDSEYQEILIDAAKLMKDENYPEAENQFRAAKACRPENSSFIEQKLNEVSKAIEKQKVTTEANRLSSIAQNVKEKDPNTALRVAEIAYTMQSPPTATSALALSSAFYKFLENKTNSYKKEINLGNNKIYESKLLGNKKSIYARRAVNGGVNEGTYIYNLQLDTLKKISDSSLTILTNNNCNFFVSFYEGYKKGQFPRIWSFDGICKAEIRGTSEEAIEVVTSFVHPILLNSKKILINANGKLILYDSLGRKIKYLNNDNKQHTFQSEAIGGRSYTTKNGKYFFTTSEGILYVWNQEGVLKKSFGKGESIELAFMFEDERRILLKIDNKLYIKSLEDESSIVLDSSETEKYATFLSFTSSNTGNFLVAHLNSPVNHNINKIIVWDKSGKVIKYLNYDNTIYQKFEFSPDERQIMICFAHNREYIANIHSLQDDNFSTIKSINFDPSVPSVSFVDNGKVIYLTDKNTLGIQDLNTKEFLKYLVHEKPIKLYEIFKNGFITKTEDEIKVWNQEGEILLYIPKQKNQSFIKHQLSEDNNTILTYGAFDNNIKLWDIKNEARILNRDDVIAFTFSPIEDELLAMGDYGFSLWNKSDNLICKTLDKEDVSSDVSVSFTTNNSGFIFCNAKRIAFYEKNGILKSERKLNLATKFDIIVSTDNKSFMCYDLFGRLMKWSLPELNLLGMLQLPRSTASYAERSPTNKDDILFCSGDTLVLLKNFDLANITKFVIDNKMYAKKAFFSKDGKQITSISAYGEVVFWNLNGTIKKKIITNHSEKNSVTLGLLSPNEQNFVTYSENSDVRIWNMNGDIVKRINVAKYKGAHIVKYSPNGDFIIIATYSNQFPMLIYDVKNGIETPSNVHIDYITDIKFSPNGKYFATYTGGSTSPSDNRVQDFTTIEQDFTARLWNNRGELIGNLDKQTDEVSFVEFTKDSNYVVTCSKDGKIIFYPTPDKILFWLRNESTLSKLSKEEMQRYEITKK